MRVSDSPFTREFLKNVTDLFVDEMRIEIALVKQIAVFTNINEQLSSEKSNTSVNEELVLRVKK